MIWVSNKTLCYQEKMWACWHKWFAWYPVVVKEYDDGAVKRVWLQTVLRRRKRYGCYDGGYWHDDYKEM
jgi:hypothetical protein